MESIDRSVPPDKVIFNEVLCDKVNSRFKKLQVKLKQSTVSDGSKAFSLDIRGLKHNFHLKFDFCKQELCFLNLEEQQNQVHEPSCFPCLDRNYYPDMVYTRLMLLWYSTEGTGKGEAKCVKVPFLQRGNINSTTTIRRLQSVIYRHISDQDSLRHWLVQVVQCGVMDMGERVYLGVTEHAMVVVLHYHILHHHAFYSSEFSVHCDLHKQQINITVTDKKWIDNNQETENFALSSTYNYVFKSEQCHQIEKRFINVKRKSLLYPQRPCAHFNILHREHSATDFIPGTTSDNVMIIPHVSVQHDNNNTGSSDSNGHLPYSLKLLNTDQVSIHPEPSPHHPIHLSSSSNGHVQTGSGSESFPSDIKQMMTDRKRIEIPVNDKHSSLLPGTSFQARGHMPQKMKLQEATVAGSRHNVFDREREQSQKKSNIEAPNEMYKALSGDSCPLAGDLHSMSTNSLARRHSSNNLPPEDDDIFPDLPLPEDDFIDDLPPPRPCRSQAHHHGEFRYKPSVPIPVDETVPKEGYEAPLDRHPTKLLRSLSFCELSDNTLFFHEYVNVEQELVLRRNVHDDSPYYRFYYNYGFVRVTRMSKKIKRRDRLSQQMKNTELDFNKLENHEQWFDHGYRYRDKDFKFCRLNNMNIKMEEGKPDYSRPLEVGTHADDPYWNSDLCVTLQTILQDNHEHVSKEIIDTFDLSSQQSVGIQMLLSLVPTDKDWRDLAEFIGLSVSDISVIEHFCYTYRELATKVVLAHWILLNNQGKAIKTCDHDSLRQFLDEIDRADIVTIIQSNPPNEEFITHF